MPAPVPCLGYPSRTQAVLALREKGKSTAEIAAAAEISTNAVLSLERTSRRNVHLDRDGVCKPLIQPKRGRNADQPFGQDAEILKRMRGHAAKRGIGLKRLARQILDAVAEGNLVDAVLDDSDEIRRA